MIVIVGFLNLVCNLILDSELKGRKIYFMREYLGKVFEFDNVDIMFLLKLRDEFWE